MSGPARPETLLRGLYLSNHLTDLHEVIFVGYLHPSYQQLDNCRCMWVTSNTRVTCKTKGCQLCNNCNILVTTGPITLKLRMHVGTHPAMYVSCVTVGVRLHVRTCKATVVPDLENGWTDRAQIWYIDGDQLAWWRAKVHWDLLCTCARVG